MRQTKGPSARERLLAATEDMLREGGMCATGIKDVAARSGAPIGSLYHYFPGGKPQLVRESLERHAAKLPQLVDQFFDGRRNAAAAVRALFDAAAEGFERAGANKGCAIGATSLDLMPSDTEIRNVCRSAFQDWTGTIASRLPLHGERARQSFATTLVAAIEGAFVLSRAAGNGQAFRDAGQWLSAMLTAAEEEASHRRTRKLTSRRKA